MKKEKTFINDLTVGPITPALLRFAIPVMLANLMQTLYNMIDMVIIGRFASSAGLSAVSSGGDIMHFFAFLGMGFATAGQIMVAQYVADYLGMELQIENMDFGYLLTALNKGDFDIVLADIEPTEKRLKAADFSESYMDELPEYILVRTEDVDKFQDPAVDFNGVSVGAQTGSTKIEKAEQNLIGCNVVSLPLVTDLVNELVNGKIDAILLDGSVAVSYDKQYDQLSIAEEASKIFPQPNGIAVAVAKGDPKGLLDGINEAIAQLKAEGKIDEFKATVDAIQGIEEVSADAPEGYESDDALMGEEEAEAVEEAAAETK